jgi:signal transduction histidine kinase
MFVLLQIIEKNYQDFNTFTEWNNAFGIITIISAVLAIAGGVTALIGRKNKTLRNVALTVGVSSGVISAFSFQLYIKWFTALPLLNFVTIAGGCLYLIWILYPHDFFLISLMSVLSGAAFYRNGQTSRAATGLYIILLLFTAAVLALTVLASKKGGLISVKGKTLRLFVGKKAAMPLYLACSINAACILAALLLGASFAYYCVYAAVGGFFVAACWYTMGLN